MSSRVPSYLRRERRQWGLTQRELASLVGISSSAHISKLESLKRVPGVDVLLAFEVLFGLSAGQLFPKRYSHMEERVLRNAEALLRELKEDDRLRAERIRELLTLVMRRAITGR